MNITISGLTKQAFTKDSIQEEINKLIGTNLTPLIDDIYFHFKVHSSQGKERFELNLKAITKNKEVNVSNLHNTESQWSLLESIKCVLQELKTKLSKDKEKTISKRKQIDKEE